MTTPTVRAMPRKDYSLLGKQAKLAVEKGLADAKWYESPIPKDKLRELLERRNGPAIRDTILWFALLIGFGVAGYLLWGTWWAIIPFAIYGVLYASSSDSRWHETQHGTAFKSDWMNNVLYEIASFMVLRESTPWRWSHTRHHSDTIIVGRDPEIAVPRPVKIANVLLAFVNWKGLQKYVRGLWHHARGRILPEEATYIPDSEYGRVFLRARIHILIYLAVFALAIATRSILPLMYIGLPSFYGAWLMVTYGLTQHAGLAEDVLDHRLNCRTVYMNAINRYLYWNMGYHVEHHMFPLVPYHALPKLHELVKPDMPPAYNGLVEAYKEIIPALLRQSHDPDWYVKRPIPTPTRLPDQFDDNKVVASPDKQPVDGWIEVCESTRLRKDHVIRFDYGAQTFAIYRTAENHTYATDGVCTHGNTHLGDGFLQGHLIECPKHNGRFDIRDGSPQRPPVCVGLKTYKIREEDGFLWLDLNSAGGQGVQEQMTTYTFRVLSARNVATYIRELELALDEGSARLEYKPGQYLQFDVPVYARRTLSDLEVNEPYRARWVAARSFDLYAASAAPVRRNYSLASNPATDQNVRITVRLATPPEGSTFDAGAGSSYMFSLRPGDRVTAIGPFGDFTIKDTDREMVYVGAGSGISPLRSHLSHLFETLHTNRKVSLWYGARSLVDVAYREYFEGLAAAHPNFRYHVALSRAEAEDSWQGRTGYVQEALLADYLSKHADPTRIEYYICGPQPMVRATKQMLAGLGVPAHQIASDEF